MTVIFNVYFKVECFRKCNNCWPVAKLNLQLVKYLRKADQKNIIPNNSCFKVEQGEFLGRWTQNEGLDTVVCKNIQIAAQI